MSGQYSVQINIANYDLAILIWYWPKFCSMAY